MSAHDILLLPTFVSAAKQDHDFRSAIDIEDAIARSIVDTQFHDACTDTPGISKIPLLHSPDASDDTRDCVAILQAPQPSSELVRLTDFRHETKCSP